MEARAIRQPEAGHGPDVQKPLAEETPERRLEVFRTVLHHHKPFLQRNLQLFSTIGEVTNDCVREWDYGALQKYQRSSACMLLYQFDKRVAGAIKLGDDTYPQQEAGGVLLLTPTLRILVYRWSQTNLVQKGRLPDNPSSVVPNRGTMKTSLTSPEEEELGKLLTASIIRRTASILQDLAYKREETLRKELDEVSSGREGAQDYLAGIR